MVWAVLSRNQRPRFRESPSRPCTHRVEFTERYPKAGRWCPIIAIETRHIAIRIAWSSVLTFRVAHMPPTVVESHNAVLLSALAFWSSAAYPQADRHRWSEIAVGCPESVVVSFYWEGSSD